MILVSALEVFGIGEAFGYGAQQKMCAHIEFFRLAHSVANSTDLRA